MKTTCTECGCEFSASEALCDDWKDPSKSFGCPSCETFFVKDMRPKFRISLGLGLLGGGVGTPAIFLLTDAIRAGDVEKIVMSSVILGSLLTAVAIGAIPVRQGLVLSSYRRPDAALSRPIG